MVHSIPRYLAVAVLASACGALPLVLSGAAAQAPAFELEETTIAKIHAAFRAKTLTCRGLVRAYLDRIEQFDKQGPALNAIDQIDTSQARDLRELVEQLRDDLIAEPPPLTA